MLLESVGLAWQPSTCSPAIVQHSFLWAVAQLRRTRSVQVRGQSQPVVCVGGGAGGGGGGRMHAAATSLRLHRGLCTKTLHTRACQRLHTRAFTSLQQPAPLQQPAALPAAKAAGGKFGWLLTHSHLVLAIRTNGKQQTGSLNLLPGLSGCTLKKHARTEQSRAKALPQ